MLELMQPGKITAQFGPPAAALPKSAVTMSVAKPYAAG